MSATNTKKLADSLGSKILKKGPGRKVAAVGHAGRKGGRPMGTPVAVRSVKEPPAVAVRQRKPRAQKSVHRVKPRQADAADMVPDLSSIKDPAR